jgi:GR25 family glycosyltransferase involved in LPS biosynthesis
MKLTDTHFFIIGVPGRYRGTELEENLSALGASYERVEGIDGQSLSRFAFEDVTDKRASKLLLGRELTKGEYGCANAHLLAYERVIDLHHKWAIVLEDDAKLSDEFIDRLEQIYVESNKPRVIQLYGIDVYRRQIQDYPWFLNALDRKCRQADLIEIRPYWEYPERTHGYLINNAAAAIAVRTMKGNKNLTPADWPHEWRKFISFSISMYQLVGLGSDTSIIESERIMSVRVSALDRFLSLTFVLIRFFNFRQQTRNKLLLRCIISVLKCQLLNVVYRFQRAALKLGIVKNPSEKRV